MKIEDEELRVVYEYLVGRGINILHSHKFANRVAEYYKYSGDMRGLYVKASKFLEKLAVIGELEVDKNRSKRLYRVVKRENLIEG